MYLDLLIKIRELLKISEVYLSHAPKDQKYVSVKRIKELTWDLYIDIVKAGKKYYKKSILYDIDCTHETLRCAWQLYFELGYLNFKDGKHNHDDNYALHRFEVINRFIDEIGKMIGAWINKIKLQETKDNV